MTLRSSWLLAFLLPITACSRGRQASPVANRSQTVGQVKLCPTTPAAPGVDDLRFSEDQFTAAQFDSAYAYFEAVLPRELNAAEKTAALTEREGFWIGYRNRLRLMKGYALKQAAILEQANGSPDSTLMNDSTSAMFRLCQFIQNVRAVD